MNSQNPSKPTPSRRERSKADKMRRILAAGEKLFSKQGFDGTTVQQIADEADVAVGTLFLYILDKSELLLRLFHNAIDRELETAIAVTQLGLEQILTKAVHLAAANAARPDKCQDQLVAHRIGTGVDPACDPVLMRHLNGPTDHRVPLVQKTPQFRSTGSGGQGKS